MQPPPRPPQPPRQLLPTPSSMQPPLRPPQPPRQLLPDHLPPGTIKQFLCDCRRHCGGLLGEVSKTTFDRHRRYRTTSDEALVLYLSPETGTPVIGFRAQAPRSIVQTHGTQAAPFGASTQAVSRSQQAFQTGLSAARTQPASHPPQRFVAADNMLTDSDSSSDSSVEDDPRPHGAPPASVLRSPPGHFGGAFSPAPSSPSARRSPASESPTAQSGREDEESDSGSAQGGEHRVNEPEVGYTEEQGAPRDAHRKELRIAQHFIDALATATLAKSGIDDDTLARLQNPRLQVPDITRGQRAGIRMYLARGDASEDNYTDVRHAMMEYLEGDRTADGIPTYEQVKRLVGQLTGITAVKTDMCPNSCVAYTGPFEKLLECPHCREPRYEPIALDRTKRVARRTFLTFPLGPQLQSLWASPETARAMRYRIQQTDRNLAQIRARPPNAPPSQSVFAFYDDLYHGRDYLNAVSSGRIARDDMVLMFSIDGAQLYASKQSDCWFYIWVLLDLSPMLRYKKRYVLPGAVIGGPNKPRNIDSFLFPGLYHLAALQTEGVRIWDAAEQRYFISYIFLLLVTADSPAMAYLNGLVGHNGACGCRLYCGQLGRHKPNHPTYYPALKRPYGDDDGPPDMSLRVETLFDSAATKKRYDDGLKRVRSAKSKGDYARERLATGIAKPSLFSGLTRFLGVPGGFALDLMHLISLNLTDLVISLLRGTLACELPDNKSTWDFAIFTDQALWKAHGQMVADATRYLPGSFDRPPRDPAKKISSGYKAWEFLLYVYGLLPGLLRHILPQKYYQHFCWLVFGARFVLQYRLPVALLRTAHEALVNYSEEYEVIYYCRRMERLHFVRPSLHTLGHVVPEASRVGPGALHTQWTMENYIGNITREIKQHVTPYANVSERALRRCQVNALKAMSPAFAEPDVPPPHAMDAGNGYLLLRARDSIERSVTPSEGQALRSFLFQRRVHLADPQWAPIVRRWARLRLPNGQITRCAWKETALEARGRKPRRARMVKLRDNRFAEVQYFFPMQINGCNEVLAMLALFSPPDADILEYSRSTLLACNYLGDASRLVVFVRDIVSVVAMVPLPMTAVEVNKEDAAVLYGQRFFVVEKPGLDVAIMAGRVEDVHTDADGLDNDV